MMPHARRSISLRTVPSRGRAVNLDMWTLKEKADVVVWSEGPIILRFYCSIVTHSLQTINICSMNVILRLIHSLFRASTVILFRSTWFCHPNISTKLIERFQNKYLISITEHLYLLDISVIERGNYFDFLPVTFHS